jgi:hypothetical protein
MLSVIFAILAGINPALQNAALTDNTPQTSIAVSKSAGPLERFAAEELQRYVNTLFHLGAPISDTPALDIIEDITKGLDNHGLGFGSLCRA